MEKENNKAVLIAGLCDDEEYVHITIEKMIMKYCKEEGIDIHLTHFYSVNSLLNSDEKLDFLLLDIEVAKMDGIEAALKLRRRGMDYHIIMLSAHEERYRDAFKIGAFRFVPKPVKEEEFYMALNDVRIHFAGLKKVKVFRDGVAFQIVQRDILYVESCHTITQIYTRCMEYRSEMTMAAWETCLDKRIFFRCHKSYIVNMGGIEKITDNEIYLITGERIPVSRRMKKNFLYAYMLYDTNYR